MVSDDESERSSSSSSSSDTDDLDASLSSITMLNLPELKKQLKRDEVLFNDNNQKPDLQATMALSKLDKLVSGEKAPRDAVVTVAKWCKMKVPELKDAIDKRNVSYKKQHRRWDLLERLIEDE